MAGVSLVTAIPILLFFARYPYFFVFRIAYVANKGLGTVEGKPWLTWLLNIGRTIRGLFWLGEMHLRHNLPGRPYLDPVQAVTFIVGIATLPRQKLQPRALFIFLWLVIMLLPTILSGDAPHFGRMTGAAPIIAILIGLGIYHISRFTFHASRITAHGLRLTFYLLLIGISTILTIRDYFGRYAAHPQIETDFYLPDWNLGPVCRCPTAGYQPLFNANPGRNGYHLFRLGGRHRTHGHFCRIGISAANGTAAEANIVFATAVSKPTIGRPKRTIPWLDRRRDTG
jgi:hypothetical protein